VSPTRHLSLQQAAKQFQALYKMFLGTDSTQVEINPLAVAYEMGGPKKSATGLALLPPVAVFLYLWHPYPLNCLSCCRTGGTCLLGAPCGLFSLRCGRQAEL
jgi:hypothetical protein